MPVGANYYRMKAKHRKWVRAAAEYLSDQFMEDLDNLAAGELWADTYMADFFPVQFRSRYDLAFAKRIWDTLIVVEWKIRDRRWWPLSSVAEELVMRAVLQTAEALAEAAEEPFDTDEYSEEISEDFDVEILFNLSLDGIEHDTLISAAMGFDLRFESWFSPDPNRLVCMEKRLRDDRNIDTSG